MPSALHQEDGDVLNGVEAKVTDVEKPASPLIILLILLWKYYGNKLIVGVEITGQVEEVSHSGIFLHSHFLCQEGGRTFKGPAEQL